MDNTRDLEQAATADNGGALDPREAARLLEQTSREARRQFSMNPPLATALMGVLILLAYGALWLSVLGQHPYTGPNLGVIALVYVTVAVDDRRDREGPPARNRRRQWTLHETAHGRGDCGPRVHPRQPRDSGRDEGRRRQRCASSMG